MGTDNTMLNARWWMWQCWMPDDGCDNGEIVAFNNFFPCSFYVNEMKHTFYCLITSSILSEWKWSILFIHCRWELCWNTQFPIWLAYLSPLIHTVWMKWCTPSIMCGWGLYRLFQAITVCNDLYNNTKNQQLLSSVGNDRQLGVKGMADNLEWQTMEIDRCGWTISNRGWQTFGNDTQ